MHILSIDQSTSGTKVLLVNKEGQIIYKKAMNHKQYYAQPGWVEHNPIEIYQCVKKLVNESMTEINEKEIVSISITNQRETVVVWDRETGQPIYNAIVWQCRRTSDLCEKLKVDGYEEVVQAKTGLRIDPYFSATKVQWILQNVEGAKKKAEQGSLLFGTIDSWLIWNLTGGKVHATDYSNASRTLLFNIHSLQWDQELLDIFSIPNQMLPEVRSSNVNFGYINDDSVCIKGLPISGVIGDSQAALFGQRCLEAGMAKATYGTGTSVMIYTGDLIEGKNGLVTSVAWGIGNRVEYGLEGIINTTGDIMKWMKEDLRLFTDLEEVSEAASSINSNEGVYLIPAFVGLGAPYWYPQAKAAIVGMTRGTNRSHLIRAGLESIAYQVTDVIQLIEEESGISIKELRVDGGATSNKFLMQYQADMLNNKVKVSRMSDLSALGSAYLAGLFAGIWGSLEELKGLYQHTEDFQPKMPAAMRKNYYTGWKHHIHSMISC
ncbi:glycerol kinase GlpK [Halalkalibacter sp. AB-rgal2]|uniref:glycerol kinase GlpK n=1 Tax=Halalkalibacter sp. AB-rgal2 TaxID=3242695 RepID=UPI00359CC364